MKKVISIILCVGLCLGLFGCGTTQAVTGNEAIEQAEMASRFVTIHDNAFRQGGIWFDILLDTETGVMYICAVNRWGIEMEPIIDADGKPLLWEGELG